MAMFPFFSEGLFESNAEPHRGIEPTLTSIQLKTLVCGVDGGHIAEAEEQAGADSVLAQREMEKQRSPLV
jgi:hypothetical protein